MTLEREAPVCGPKVNGLRDYASVWVDLLHVGQVLHLRDEMTPGTNAQEIFTRRALWEAVVVAYGRCFATGQRQTNVRDLIAQLAEPLRACHQEIIDLRNGQVAHSGQARTEVVAARAVIDPVGNVMGIRLRVFPSMGPVGTSHDEPTFATLVAQLKDLVWERKLQLIERAVVAEQDAVQLARIAVPFESKSAGGHGAVLVTINPSS